MKFQLVQDSRQGARASNQDCVAHAWSSEAVLLVVADGMGGHRHGEIAADTATRALIDRFRDGAQPRLERPAQFLSDALLQAHSAINHVAYHERLTEIPHTTCVAAVIQDGALHWTHAGDSRLYLVRRGRVLFQSEDHSAVAQLVREGRVSPADALVHPDRNKVTNCLGGSLEPELARQPALPLRDGDIVLLCTDGLWGAHTAEDIAATLAAQPLDAATQQLLDAAEIRAGGQCDNLSLVALLWGEPRADARAAGRGGAVSPPPHTPG